MIRNIQEKARAILSGLALLGAVAIAPGVMALELRLLTEEYPPFSFREGDSYKGSSIDQIQLLMKDAGIPYSIEMMPWARALSLAESQPDACVFSTAHNEERHTRFKWVEPILKGRTILIRKAGTDVRPATLEEARQFTVGTQRDDFTADILTKGGFPKLDLASDFNITLNKLLRGRIDLMPISETYFHKLRREGTKIEHVLLLAEQVYSIACNTGVADETIASMQASLDKLIEDGTQDRIFKSYGLETERD